MMSFRSFVTNVISMHFFIFYFVQSFSLREEMDLSWQKLEFKVKILSLLCGFDSFKYDTSIMLCPVSG